MRAFEEIEALAGRRGVAIRGSELVGLAPERALDREIARRVCLADFDPDRHLIESVARP